MYDVIGGFQYSSIKRETRERKEYSHTRIKTDYGRRQFKVMSINEHDRFNIIFHLRFNDHPVLNNRYLLLHLIGKGGFSEVHKVIGGVATTPAHVHVFNCRVMILWSNVMWHVRFIN